MGKLTIGVTIHLTSAPGIGIWSNGASQNCIFLWMLLRAAGHQVYLINGGESEEPPPAFMLQAVEGLSVVRIQDILDQLDVLIECGSQVSPQNAARVKARGGRVIAYRFGNNFVIDTERTLFKDGTGSCFNGVVFDEVWTIPQHANTCSAFFETIHRCPVRILPHIWEPTFIDAAIREFPEELSWGYKPGRAKKRLAVYEPNISVLKNSIMPLLVVENAFRLRPDLVDHVWITNTEEMRTREMFVNLAWQCDLQRFKKPGENVPFVSFEGRFNLPYWLAKSTDVVVSWQWENGLNYAYYDALYGGYPFVHNSKLLPKGVGYYYEGFDCIEGGRILASVLLTHDAHHEEYQEKAKAFLQTVRVTHQANIDAHEMALARRD